MLEASYAMKVHVYQKLYFEGTEKGSNTVENKWKPQMLILMKMQM